MKRAFVFLAFSLLWPQLADAQQRPADFVDAAEAIPALVTDVRYHTSHNFVGAPIDGYQAPKCLLTRQAADALARVQAELLPQGLALKVYDCYRPQRAVDHFVRWAEDLQDVKTKAEFYPTVDKADLFSEGYIASKSSHSRGSTVDLTIVPLPTPPQEAYTGHENLRACYLPADQRFGDNSVDMGTGFDCFHPLSHTANPKITGDARQNRMLLKFLMEKQGFENYSQEWWHYTLKNEPYPDTYFDFPVR